MESGIPEDAKPIEEGLSNKVYFHGDEVYKYYSFFPLPGLYASLLELFRGRLIFFSRKRRMRNEIKMAGLVEKAGLEIAEIRKVQKKIIVFEKINGVSGFRYLSAPDKDVEARELGERLREFLEDLHSMDVALKDARLSNFLVEDDRIHSIDHEYASLEAGKFFKILDELTLLSSVRQTPHYREFRDGFEPHRYAVLLSIVTAFYHITLFNRDLDRVKNLWRSLKA